MVEKLQYLEKLYGDHRFKAYVVFQNPDQRAQVEELAQKCGTSFPVGLLAGGIEGPGGQKYKLNPHAENTALVMNGNKVQANYVNLKPQTFIEVALAAGKMLTSS